MTVCIFMFSCGNNTNVATEKNQEKSSSNYEGIWHNGTCPGCQAFELKSNGSIEYFTESVDQNSAEYQEWIYSDRSTLGKNKLPRIREHIVEGRWSLSSDNKTIEIECSGLNGEWKIKSPGLCQGAGMNAICYMKR